jgi:hypothetical protein
LKIDVIYSDMTAEANSEIFCFNDRGLGHLAIKPSPPPLIGEGRF